jgi:protein AroM
MNGRTARLGALTIGQSPRVDILPEFLAAIGVEVEIVQRGALDGMSVMEVEKLVPTKDDCLLVTRMQDGSEVRLSERLILDKMKRCVHELEEAGVELIALFCTGEFPDLGERVPILRPNFIMERLVPALIPGGRLCAVAPSRDQIPAIMEKWSRSGCSTYAESVSPYTSTMDDLRRCAARVARLDCDLVVLDCIGYSGQARAVFREIVDRPVILPRRLLGSIAREMLGL